MAFMPQRAVARVFHAFGNLKLGLVLLARRSLILPDWLTSPTGTWDTSASSTAGQVNDTQTDRCGLDVKVLVKTKK